MMLSVSIWRTSRPREAPEHGAVVDVDERDRTVGPAHHEQMAARHERDALDHRRALETAPGVDLERPVRPQAREVDDADRAVRLPVREAAAVRAERVAGTVTGARDEAPAQAAAPAEIPDQETVSSRLAV
jgi:hypothetical protein